MKRQELNTVIEELRQSMVAKGTKVKRYQQKTERFKQNRIFYFDQKKMYAEFNGDDVRPNDVPNVEESKRFVDDIWSARKWHNRETEWWKDIGNEAMREDV